MTSVILVRVQEEATSNDKKKSLSSQHFKVVSAYVTLSFTLDRTNQRSYDHAEAWEEKGENPFQNHNIQTQTKYSK